jgi:diguanylate cyclase (GGDEF)-like protein
MSEHWILLLDPFKNLLNAYRMILQGEKYLVETTINLEEASHRLSLRHYSIFITEYIPPFEDTYRMIQWVKQNLPETYIIMVTNAIIDDTTYEILFDIGVDDLILKPYSPEKILVHIKKGLRQRDLILKKQELETQSLLDPITQRIQQFIFNPIYFKKCLRQELKRAKRHQHPLSLLLIQIPAREKIGDRIESLYMELAKILKKYVREEDIVGKVNGNFGILLAETDQIGLQALVQRLSNLIQTHSTFQSDEVLRHIIQTLSFRSFTYPDQFSIPESLKIVFEEVDQEYPRH